MLGCFSRPKKLGPTAGAHGNPGAGPRLEGASMVFCAGLAQNVEQGRLQLSPLDHTAILTCVNPKALWFRYALDPTIVRSSLSVVLRRYPCFSGRLMPCAPGHDEQRRSHIFAAWHPPPARATPQGVTPLHVLSTCRDQAYAIVLCNAGVEFRVAHAPSWTVDDFTQDTLGRKGFSAGPGQAIPKLPPWFEGIDTCDLIGGRTSPLKIRLTQLGCGGCIVAFTFSHALVDGRSCCSFLANWAQCYRQLATAGPAPIVLPVNNRSDAANGAGCSDSNGPVNKIQQTLQNGPTSSSTPATVSHVPPSHDRHLLLPSAAPRAPQAHAPVVQILAHAATTSSPTAPQAQTYRRAVVLGNVWDTATATQAAHPVKPPPSPSAQSSPLPLSSLQLQALPQKPSWREAIKGCGRALRMLREEEAQWPNMFTDLTTTFIHIPTDTVAHIKATATSLTCFPGVHLSTNDAMAALVWVLTCDLRGRPLPGAAPPGCNNALGMAVDLRMNGLSGHLPLNLCANATWCINISSSVTSNTTSAPQIYLSSATTGQAQTLTTSTHTNRILPDPTAPPPTSSRQTQPTNKPSAPPPQTACALGEGADSPEPFPNAPSHSHNDQIDFNVPATIYSPPALTGTSTPLTSAPAAPVLMTVTQAAAVVANVTHLAIPSSSLPPAPAQIFARPEPATDSYPSSPSSHSRSHSISPTSHQAQPTINHAVAEGVTEPVPDEDQPPPFTPDSTSQHGISTDKPTVLCTSLDVPAAVTLHQGPDAAMVHAGSKGAAVGMVESVGTAMNAAIEGTAALAKQNVQSIPEQPAQRPTLQQAWAMAQSSLSKGRPSITYAGRPLRATLSTFSMHPNSVTNPTKATMTTPTAGCGMVQAGRTNSGRLLRSCSTAAVSSSLLLSRQWSASRPPRPAGASAARASAMRSTGVWYGGSAVEGHVVLQGVVVTPHAVGESVSPTPTSTADTIQDAATSIGNTAGDTATALSPAEAPARPTSGICGAGGPDLADGNVLVDCDVHANDGDKQRFAAALREGAARIRAALVELRARDSPRSNRATLATEPAQDMSLWRGQERTDRLFSATLIRPSVQPGRGESAPGEGASENDQGSVSLGRQRGWDIVEHALALARAPMSAQLAMASNVYCGQDVMVTSWQFPYYGIDLGKGGPVRLQGIVHPSPPWCAALQSAPPDLGGMLIQMNTPTSALTALKKSAVLAAMCPGARVLG